MSFSAFKAAFKELEFLDVSPSAKLCLVALGWHAALDDVAAGTTAEIAEMCGLSETATKKAISALKAERLVTELRGGRGGFRLWLRGRKARTPGDGGAA